jgi:hypothetical protein
MVGWGLFLTDNHNATTVMLFNNGDDAGNTIEKMAILWGK